MIRTLSVILKAVMIERCSIQDIEEEVMPLYDHVFRCRQLFNLAEIVMRHNGWKVQVD